LAFIAFALIIQAAKSGGFAGRPFLMIWRN
jgi:hypothetical protein